MYVRWKRRATREQVCVGRKWTIVEGQRKIEMVRDSRPTGDFALSAQLVESRRVDGKPGQKVIKYLGTISERGIQHVGHRIGFWRTVGAALKTLNLPSDQQRTIEQALNARVPFPTEEEIQAEHEHFRRLEQGIRQRM